MDDVVRCEAEGELSLCVLTGYRAYEGVIILPLKN